MIHSLSIIQNSLPITALQSKEILAVENLPSYHYSKKAYQKQNGSKNLLVNGKILAARTLTFLKNITKNLIVGDLLSKSMQFLPESKLYKKPVKDSPIKSKFHKEVFLQINMFSHKS